MGVGPLASQALQWVTVVTPSLPREPVVPPGSHAQLPAGLQLGARVQQRAPRVRGAPGPGLMLTLGWGPRGLGSCSGLPTAAPTVPPRPRLGLQQVCVLGLGHRQQSAGQPQPEPGHRVSPHRRAAPGAQGAGLGLRHRGERVGMAAGCTCSPLAWGWWETGQSLRGPWAPAVWKDGLCPRPPAAPVTQLSPSGGLGPHLRPGQRHQGPQEHRPGDGWRAGPPRRALQCGRHPAGGRGPRLLLRPLPTWWCRLRSQCGPMSLPSEGPSLC